MQFTLYEGSGFDGDMLTSFGFSLSAEDDMRYVYFDLFSIPLTVGESYTAALADPTATWHWGTDFKSNSDPYPMGTQWRLSGPVPVDFMFRVIPMGAPIPPFPPPPPGPPAGVPEPSTVGLFGLGFLALVIMRRKLKCAAPRICPVV